MSSARPLFQPEPDPTPWTPRRKRARWARIVGWIAGSLVVLVLLVAATIAVLLNSARFHDYVLAKVRSEASESLGVKVEVQNFALHFFPLGLDVYGVTVHGANPYPDPPLLQLQHAEVGVRIVSVFQRKWYLSGVTLDHPVVQILVDKNNVSNLPTIKSSSNSSSNTSIFDLGIRHAVLDRGEIYYNAEPSALSADLHDVDFRASFNELQKMYSGRLAYSKGHVVFGAYQPFEHNFEAQFDLTPTTFQLHRANISSGATQINLAATATNFSAPHVDALYDVTVDGGQMAKMMANPSIPEGMVHATGSAEYQQDANQTALNSVTVNGDVRSKQLVVKTPSLRAAVGNLAAHYSLAHGDATLHDFKASVLGGEITAQGTMKQIAGNSRSEMTASVRHISLADANRLMASKSPQSVAISGELNADAKAAWGKTFDDLIAKADATIHAQATGPTQPAGNQAAAAGQQNAAASKTFAPVMPGAVPGVVPIESAIHATYTGARQEISLSESYLRTPQTTLTMNGTVSKHSSLALHLQANDLREVATIANLFRAPTPGQAQQPIDLTGSATFQGNVQGSTTAPHLTGQLSASNLNVNGTALKVFRTNVDVSPSQASLQHAELEPLPRGRITLDASAGLNKWSFSNTSPVQVTLDASQIDLASLAKMAGQQVPVTGTLNTHVAVHGTELNPVGNGSLSLKGVVAYDQPVSSVEIKFAGTGDEAHADLTVQTPAGNVQSNVSVRPKDKTYTAKLTSTGIHLDKLQAVQAKNIGAVGVLAIIASGQGSFDNPQLTASLQIPTLTVQKQTIQNIDLKMDVANHLANATLTSTAVNTSIQAKAKVVLTGDYQTDASLDTQNIELQPIVAMFAPAQAGSLSGQTEIHATVHGPAKDKNALEAHLSIPYLRTNYNNMIQLAAAAPIQADYKNGIVTLRHSVIRGTDTDLEFEGSIPVVGDAPMSLLLQGNVNLQLAQLFDPDARTSGQIKFNINSKGTTGKDIGGEIDIVDANYASADLPVGLQHANGVLTMTTDRINIKSFEGTVGGGAVTAQGGVAYRPDISFDLGMSAKGIRMLYPQGMRESIDANIHLAGTMDDATLGGTVNLADLSFTPAFDLTSFISQFSGGVASPPSMGMAQNISLDLAVRSTNNVNLVSRELSVNGAANRSARHVAVDGFYLVAGFLQALVHLFGHHDAAVLAAGAAEGYGQIALAFLHVMGQQVKHQLVTLARNSASAESLRTYAATLGSWPVSLRNSGTKCGLGRKRTSKTMSASSGHAVLESKAEARLTSSCLLWSSWPKRSRCGRAVDAR
jgi:translocation and assembly module TamB